MISQKMQDALNDQVAYEFYSAHIYLSMSAYLASIDLPGFANWMRVQYQEEVTHAEKIFDYVIERDGRAILGKFDAPPTEWKSPLHAFEEALAHERKVTARFNGHMDLAIAEKLLEANGARLIRPVRGAQGPALTVVFRAAR